MGTILLARGDHLSPWPEPGCHLGSRTDVNRKRPSFEYFPGPIVTIRLKLYFAMGKPPHQLHAQLPRNHRSSGRARGIQAARFRWAHYGPTQAITVFPRCPVLLPFEAGRSIRPIRPWGVGGSQLGPTAVDTEQQTRYLFLVFAVRFVGLPAVPQDF